MKSQSFTRYSAIACVLALVGCSSSDDNTNPDASVEAGRDGSGGSGGSTANEASVPDARAADVTVDASVADVSREAAAEAAADAGVDVRAEAAADAPSEARPDADAAAVEAGQDAATVESDAAAPDSGSTVEDDADLAADSSTPPDAEVSEGGGGYVRPECTPPTFTGPAVTPASATILDMESATSAFTQAVPSDPTNWDEPSVPASSDAAVRSPHEFVAITPARGASTRGIHSFASGYEYGGSVVLPFMNTFLRPLDASRYQGITFFARGSAATTSLQVEVSVTGALEQYCRCDPGGGPLNAASRCNDNPSAEVTLTNAWQQFTIPWAQFVQAGYGNPVSTDPTQLLNVVIRPQGGASPGTWDFWLDDVAFAAAP